MQDEVYYAIPSYLRSDKQETVDYLRSVGIPKERIYVFVQTEDDYSKYKAAHGDKCEIIYREADSVPKARNNILRFFKKEKNILMMDDDVSRFETGSKESRLEELESPDTVIASLFDITKRLHGQIFGLYPVDNNFFMKDSVCMKKPVNTVIGFPKGFPLLFDESYIAKEDIELCGRIMDMGGSIVRFNNITFKARHRTNDGGCKDVWKSGVNAMYAKQLTMTYPDIYAVKGNNRQEIRTIVADRTKRIKPWK